MDDIVVEFENRIFQEADAVVVTNLALRRQFRAHGKFCVRKAGVELRLSHRDVWRALEELRKLGFAEFSVQANTWFPL